MKKKQNILEILREIKKMVPLGLSSSDGYEPWKVHGQIIIDAGMKIIEEIEGKRAEVHKAKIHFLYFKNRKTMEILDNSYHQLCEQYELFFDVVMRFRNAIFVVGITGGEQARCLLEHSSKSMDALSALVSRKYEEYRHCQTLFVALIAIIIASTSTVFSLLAIVLRP